MQADVITSEFVKKEKRPEITCEQSIPGKIYTCKKSLLYIYLTTGKKENDKFCFPETKSRGEKNKNISQGTGN